MTEISMWINEREIQAVSGQTIMEAADRAGIAIPRLCYHPFLEPSGSCRLCAVEIEGKRGLPAACSTEVEVGMRVRTHTSKVLDFRREMLRLILERHPRECLGCSRNGTCELQQLVKTVGIDFPYGIPVEERPAPLPGGSYFERDYSLCVHCGRCVRVCHEIRGAKAIVFRERNGIQEVGTAFERPLDAAGCQFCGACVDVCPVGALHDLKDGETATAGDGMVAVCGELAKLVMDLYKVQRKPESESSVCAVCGAGCRLSFQVDGQGAITASKPHPLGPANKGQACVQGRYLLPRRAAAQRLPAPLVRENGAVAETSLESALDTMAQRFKGYGPGEVAVLTDAMLTNEELYQLRKFSLLGLKTNAVGILQSHAVLHTASYLRDEQGVYAAPGRFEDLKDADCIVAVGVNPAAVNPILGVRLREAMLAGAKTLVIAPCETALSRNADVHLPCPPGTEDAVLFCLMGEVLKRDNGEDALRKATGLDGGILKEFLLTYDPHTIQSLTGVSHELLAEAVDLLAPAKVLAAIVGEGPDVNGVGAATVGLLAMLCRMKESYGKPGGGLYPALGTGNFQGAWDMGMVPFLLPGQVSVDDAAGRERLTSLWGGNTEAPGVVCPIKSMSEGQVKAAWIIRERLDDSGLAALTPFLSKLDFVVIQDVNGPLDGERCDLALPLRSMLQKPGTVTSAERRVQAITPVLTAPKSVLCVRGTIKELAARMGVAGFDNSDPKVIYQEIRKAAPGYEGISLEKAASGTVQWPCPDEKHPGTPVLFADEPVPAGSLDIAKASLDGGAGGEYPHRMVAAENLACGFAGPMLAPEAESTALGTGDFAMHPADAYGLGLMPGQEVRLVTPAGELTGGLYFNIRLPRGMVAVSAGSIPGGSKTKDGKAVCVPVRVEDPAAEMEAAQA